jgi:anaerobic magnesium-protoporphyrin IX monomethyl ester cyclase
MKALFCIPPVAFNPRQRPVDRVYGCNYGYDYKPAIHFLQVATVAQERLGWSVRFLDCPAEDVDPAAFQAHIVAGDYDVALFWSTYLSAVEDLEAARRLQKVRPDIKIVFMGTAPTWKPDEFFLGRNTWCLLGEPEDTLTDLAKIWRGEKETEGTPGLAWYTDDAGTWSRGPFRDLLDVSLLPMPDRGLLRGAYRANRLDVHPVTTMAVSRGCGFRCTFCCTNAVDQAIELEFKRLQETYVKRPPLRKRTVEQIVAEFQDIAARGIKGVEIADNIFTWGKTRTQEICEGIEPLGLHWICLARANMLHDPEMIRSMARAGCKLVYMGSESFDDGLLDDMMKELKVKDVVKAVKTCHENGVEPEVSVLIGGSPQETWKTLINSFRTARGLGTRFVHFSAALPAPSTQLYDEAIKNGWFQNGDFHPADNQREVIIDLPNLSGREIALALKLAYAGQYLTPRGILRQVQNVRSFEDLRHKTKSAWNLISFLGTRDPSPVAIPPGRVTPLG